MILSVFDRPSRQAFAVATGLFVLTAISVTWTGGPDGPWLAVSLLAILLAHEMGHYVACRIHGVDCTPPYFIPAPIINPLAGTLGALILIRDRFPSRRALFDIGIAGPLAGLVVCIPVLVLGVLHAQLVPYHPDLLGEYLGEPLVFQWATRALRGPIPDGMTLRIGPFGTAAWFGLFITALNLMPIGQLDGGHVLYAVLRRRAYVVARAAWWVCVALIILSPSWIMWAVLTYFIGRPHPRTLDDYVPLGGLRLALSGVALVAFVLCFTPEPVESSWRLMRMVFGG